jgi:signal transduction histidine kinase
LTIADDGIGFDTSQKHRGHGLLSMDERSRLLGGDLHIQSAPGMGTKVRLRLDTRRINTLYAGPA